MENYKIEEIDGVKVLFLDNDKDLGKIDKSTMDIGLIVIGNKTDLMDRLYGRNLSEFLIDPKENKIDLTNLPPPKTFKIESLPIFEEPLIGFDYQKMGWKGDPKWYDQYNKRNRKKKR